MEICIEIHKHLNVLGGVRMYKYHFFRKWWTYNILVFTFIHSLGTSAVIYEKYTCVAIKKKEALNKCKPLVYILMVSLHK